MSFVAGRLKIGASLTIGEYFLPEFLGIFNKKYPYINVMVEMGNTTHMSDLLKAYKLDLAVVEGTVVSDKLEKEHLFRDKLVIIAPLDYKEKIGMKILVGLLEKQGQVAVCSGNI